MEIDIKKVIIEILQQKYYEEFVDSDGMSSHVSGWSFSEWLEENNYLLT